MTAAGDFFFREKIRLVNHYQSKKEKIQFYFTSKGSLTELQNQLLIAKDVGYLKRNDFDEIAQKTVQVGKLTSGLIKSSSSKP